MSYCCWTSELLINKKGSPHSKPLSDLAVQLWELCLAKNITVKAEHIPGVEIVRADWESRRRPDPSDWRMDSKVFLQFNRLGPLQVDLFAARHNAQLPQYFSFKADPGAVAVDIFAQDWSALTPYAFPPFLMMSTEDQGREGREGSNSDPSMEQSSMVFTTPPHEHQQSLPSSAIR